MATARNLGFKKSAKAKGVEGGFLKDRLGPKGPKCLC